MFSLNDLHRYRIGGDNITRCLLTLLTGFTSIICLAQFTVLVKHYLVDDLNPLNIPGLLLIFKENLAQILASSKYINQSSQPKGYTYCICWMSLPSSNYVG